LGKGLAGQAVRYIFLLKKQKGCRFHPSREGERIDAFYNALNENSFH